MTRINLLNHKTSRRRLWMEKNYYHGELPEIVMEGSEVLHTDEHGNILLDENSDQRLNNKREHELRIRELSEELFKIGKDGPNERIRGLVEELFEGDEILCERMENMRIF
jgi:hypothetical protein